MQLKFPIPPADCSSLDRSLPHPNFLQLSPVIGHLVFWGLGSGSVHFGVGGGFLEPSIHWGSEAVACVLHPLCALILLRGYGSGDASVLCRSDRLLTGTKITTQNIHDHLVPTWTRCGLWRRPGELKVKIRDWAPGPRQLQPLLQDHRRPAGQDSWCHH